MIEKDIYALGLFPRMPFEQFLRMRLQCKTDLFFLGREILNKDFTDFTHRKMCEFYVQKDPRYGTFKNFAENYSGPHDRIQLVPRNAYKSSIKVVDNVQWIITWPEVRIMTVTSNDPLSTAFIDELIGYFTVAGKLSRNSDTGFLEPGGRPTDFQKLFWEHCITESEARTGELVTPMRRHLNKKLVFKEPTAGTLSITSSSSGWHCDVIDFDDPVSDRNAETGKPEMLEKIDNRMAMVSELLMNYGFRHIVATRYDQLDPYGKILKNAEISDLYGDFDTPDLKAMMRPCWWLKGKPYVQPDYDKWTPRAEDVDLFFPEGSPFEALRRKMKNPKTFSSQQLNNPSNVVHVQFTEQMIRDAVVDHTALPKEGTPFTSWDFAYGQADSNEDFSVGIMGFLDRQRRWWITRIICTHMNFSEKCYQVVKAIREHRPLRTCIEDTPGVKGAMEEPIYRQSLIDKVPLNIDWISTGQGVSDAKYLRMCALHPWITEHRLFFVNTIDCFDEVIRHFRNVRSKTSSGSKLKNDIPDAIARMVQQYSGYAQEVKAPTQSESARQFLELAEAEASALIFRTGKYAEGGSWDRGEWNADYVPPPQLEEALDPESPSYAIDEMFRV